MYMELWKILSIGRFLASQMWTLGRYLPMMIGSKISTDDEHWRCYCNLVNITQYLFAPRLEENDLAILQMLIQSHHETCIRLQSEC